MNGQIEPNGQQYPIGHEKNSRLTEVAPFNEKSSLDADEGDAIDVTATSAFDAMLDDDDDEDDEDDATSVPCSVFMIAQLPGNDDTRSMPWLQSAPNGHGSQFNSFVFGDHASSIW